LHIVQIMCYIHTVSGQPFFVLRIGKMVGFRRRIEKCAHRIAHGGKAGPSASPPYSSCLSTILAPASPAASILAWGRQRLDTAHLLTNPSNPFTAIAPGYWHSLALQRVCQYVLAGDLNDDCEINFDDFAPMAATWLIDCNTDPNNPACIPK